MRVIPANAEALGGELRQLLQRQQRFQRPRIADVAVSIRLLTSPVNSGAIAMPGFAPTTNKLWPRRFLSRYGHGLLQIEEPSQRVVVLNFGIAKQLETGSQFTRAGTPRYCAPEQLLGRPITGSADVYSLGLVLYEMIAGKQFFAGLDENAILTEALDSSCEYDVETQLKMLRARIRQAYRRPVVEEKLIVRALCNTDLDRAMHALLETAARLAQRGLIEEQHLVSALLEDIPVELRPVLQASGMTLANLQKCNREQDR